MLCVFHLSWGRYFQEIEPKVAEELCRLFPEVGFVSIRWNGDKYSGVALTLVSGPNCGHDSNSEAEQRSCQVFLILCTTMLSHKSISTENIDIHTWQLDQICRVQRAKGVVRKSGPLGGARPPRPTSRGIPKSSDISILLFPHYLIIGQWPLVTYWLSGNPRGRGHISLGAERGRKRRYEDDMVGYIEMRMKSSRQHCKLFTGLKRRSSTVHRMKWVNASPCQNLVLVVLNLSNQVVAAGRPQGEVGEVWRPQGTHGEQSVQAISFKFKLRHNLGPDDL